MWALACVAMLVMVGSLATVLVPIFLSFGVLAVCRSSHWSGHFCTKFSVARLCAFLILCRIGEASNPGPEDSCFILGVANPSGLRSKAPYVSTQMGYGDVWAFSETHLCARELASFNSGLKFAGAPFQPMVGGCPVPSHGTNSGCWKGVGVLAKTPVRRIPHDWPPEIANSSRALAVTTLVDDAWLTGGVVYGEPESHLYPDRLRHTEALLQAVVGTICYLSSGPRFVAGDWNVNFGELPVFDMLAQAGFRDLQELAAERWGIMPKHTCKHRTRKDYCFISPELQSLLCDVSVISDVWPDHAILQGHFARLGTSVPRDHWRMPSEFPWPVQWDVPADLWSGLNGSPSEKYTALWKCIEESATRVLPFAPSRRTCGRGQTKSPVQRKTGQCPPVKVGRAGDFAPQFFGASFRHAQWVRQVRRIQAYIRHVAAQSAHTPYAAEVWHAVLVAKGFVGGFATWWDGVTTKTFGSPGSIPWNPPSHAVACCIFETMVIEVRMLEASLKATSRQYARLRRAKRPNVIFRDLKDPPPGGVDFLLKPLAAQVVEVCESECAIVVDSPLDWPANCQVFCNGSELEVVHADHDCVWVSDVSSVQAGQVVTCLRKVGSKQDLCNAFIKEWSQRWDRHRDVPHDRWQTILSFARRFLPRCSMSWPSLGPAELTHLVARKKKTSASGLDGVSISDLRSMPIGVMTCFCQIFQDAEADGSWPSQLLEGKVVSLAKHDSPSEVLDYRPITILGLLYRCWGSFHSRHAIRQLESVLPDTLFGSRPSRYAGQVWAQLLWAVEAATANQIALTGIFADIQKAFNCLPRLVVLEAAAIVGVPMQILVAWAGALVQLSRRFQLGDYLSPPVFSSTGMPEGDGLSCLGMVVVDMLFHVWHRFFFPLCQPVSYVDDWTLITTDPASIADMYACLCSFTDAIDLQIDAQKTNMWSVCTHGRKTIVEAGFSVVSNCRSLGAHIQFSRKHTNASQMKRVGQLQKVWPKLRLSAAAYGFKVHAIRAAAWPRGLHAISATTIANATFKSLRAGAMKGLDADGSGVNSHIHLGLVERPETDPQFWATMQTFRMVRDCGIPEVVGPVLSALVGGDERFAGNGITSTLLTRIQTFGWHVGADDLLVDAFGSFSLFDISIEELKYRMEWAWLGVVAARVAHRPGFADLVMADPGRTRGWLRSLSVADQACFRKLLNGAHVTQDGKHYSQECESDVCLYCSSSDSRFHRFWQCPFFDDCRRDICPQLLVAVPELPDCMVSYGWALRPSTFHEWASWLAQIPEQVAPVVELEVSDWLHMFTDGSCANPQYPDCRFAGWAVILADPSMLVPATILDSGILPGLRQTSVRAELYAVHRALRFAAINGRSVHVWSDCAAVVSRLGKLLMGGHVRPNSPNADLWRRIFEDLRSLGHDRVRITKVAAHKQVSHAASPFEEWAFLHNHFSDQSAGRANLQRSGEFWELLTRHVQACLLMDRWNADVQRVLLRVSHVVLRGEVPPSPVVVLPETVPVVPQWSPLRSLQQLPSKAVRWYGDAIVRSIVSWWWGTLFSATGPVCWVSHLQLFIDYTSSTGLEGPVKHNGWKEGSNCPLLSLVQPSFKQRTKWFIKVVKETLRHLQIPLVCAFCKPSSAMIAMYVGCVAVPWPKCRIDAVDRWLLQFTDQPYRRQSKAIDSLPIARRQPGFPSVFLTSCQ